MPLPLALALVPLLIACNAFFVAAEYALVAARSFQIEALRLRGFALTAAAMSSLKERPASSIGAIQVCITMTNLLLGWIAEPAMSSLLEMAFGPVIRLHPALFGGVAIAISFIIVTLLTVVLSELLPKALTLRFVEPAAILTAVPMRAVSVAVTPLVWIMNGLANLITRAFGLGRVTDMEERTATAEEIMLIASEAAEDGVVTTRERSLILNSLALGRRRARQIMVPRLKVAFLDLQKNMDDNRAMMGEQLFSRYPLCNGGMDQVIGVIHVKEFLAAYNEAGDSTVMQLISRPATFAPSTIALDRLLEMFTAESTQMIILVDEYGTVEGMVTLRDVVDELLIVGAPEDLATGKQLVPGETPLHELAARIGRPQWSANSEVVTVGGLVVAQIGRVPRPGVSVIVDGVQLKVVSSDRVAVRVVEVSAAPPEAGA